MMRSMSLPREPASACHPPSHGQPAAPGKALAQNFVSKDGKIFFFHPFLIFSPPPTPAALSFPVEIPREEAALSGAKIKSILDVPVFAIPLLVNPGMYGIWMQPVAWAEVESCFSAAAFLSLIPAVHSRNPGAVIQGCLHSELQLGSSRAVLWIEGCFCFYY